MYASWGSCTSHVPESPKLKAEITKNANLSRVIMLDDKTSQVLDKYQDTLYNRRDENSDDDFDEDDFMDMIDNDPSLAGYREKRLQELSQQMNTAKRNLEAGGYGTVLEVNSEKEVLEKTTKVTGDGTKLSIVHFHQPEFQRCKIMSKRLETLAQKHLNTQFLQVNASKAPFLASKLGIRVLPFVIGYVNGREAIRLVGFEQLGNSDDFKVEALEALLIRAGVLRRHANLSSTRKERVRSEQADYSDSE